MTTTETGSETRQSPKLSFEMKALTVSTLAAAVGAGLLWGIGGFLLIGGSLSSVWLIVDHAMDRLRHPEKFDRGLYDEK